MATTDERVAALEAKLDGVHDQLKRVDALKAELDVVHDQLKAARTAFRISRWWAGVVTLLVAGLLGYTMWDIPRRVDLAMQGEPIVRAREAAEKHSKAAGDSFGRILALEAGLGDTAKLRAILDEFVVSNGKTTIGGFVVVDRTAGTLLVRGLPPARGYVILRAPLSEKVWDEKATLAGGLIEVADGKQRILLRLGIQELGAGSSTRVRGVVMSVDENTPPNAPKVFP